MYPIDYIYTPPEIIAREVKKEFDRPKAATFETPSKKKLNAQMLMIWLGVMTAPIWMTLVAMMLVKSWFGF